MKRTYDDGPKSTTDRKRAESMLLDAAGNKEKGLQRKTEMRAILKAAYKEFIQQKKQQDARLTAYSRLPPGIEDQLYCGAFDASDTGIYVNEYASDGEVSRTRVCSHPLLPVEYLEGVEDGLQRVRLAYYKHDRWHYNTVERSVISSRQTIVKLSALGIDVTTETGRHLVQYLADIEAANEGRIPRNRSISRLGWVGEEFSPYIDSIRFDGDDVYKDIFTSIGPFGSFEEWLRVMLPVRKAGGLPKLVLASSFAAPIVGILNGLPFFLHMWGETESGKTVTLMTAASVWGDPNLGRLVRSFSSTGVGMELLASFLHNIPVCLDELQAAKVRDGNFDGTIYMLGEGQGKTRGNADGGMRKLNRWRTIILSNGEQPITTSRSGGGAKNRVLEAEVTGARLFEDPRDVAETVKMNYGHAGQLYTSALKRIGKKGLKEAYTQAVQDIQAVSESTDKQNYSAAYLLTADRIAAEEVFRDTPMAPVELLAVLSERDDVDPFGRAYEHVMSWVAGNPHRFEKQGEYETERWGKWMDDGCIAIIGTVLEEELSRAGFSYKAFLAGADRANMLNKGVSGKRTKAVRLATPGAENATPIRCAVLRQKQGQTTLY
ncbi:DUF927 domain-containing protein [Eubacteriales bacterium OttesenSCG-928-A19]|nr:DUF927 domain-containing protein [Eubacteriales bacterium OttesenSCG-928-A19]